MHGADNFKTRVGAYRGYFPAAAVERQAHEERSRRWLLAGGSGVSEELREKEAAYESLKFYLGDAVLSLVKWSDDLQTEMREKKRVLGTDEHIDYFGRKRKLRLHEVPMHREVQGSVNAALQEKYHRRILEGARNFSDTLYNNGMK